MISTPKLGALVNTVQAAEETAPWAFGIRELIGNLASRGLLN